MDIFSAIYGRQSIPQVRPDALPRQVIEKLLDAAVQAPNHHRVRPWRFIVLTGEARQHLGEVMAEGLRRRNPQAPDTALEIERARPLRAPLLIAVGVDRPDDPKVVEIENVCAAAAAAQNLLLAAHALGLAGMWRSGPAAIDPGVKAFLGLEPEQHLIAFLYLGYPQAQHAEHPEHPSAGRPGFEDRTVWLE